MTSRSSCASATGSLGAFMRSSGLASAYGGDDLDLVAGNNERGCVPASRNNLTVLFDGNTLALESKLVDEIGHRRAGAVTDVARAIDDDVEHDCFAAQNGKAILTRPRTRPVSREACCFGLRCAFREQPPRSVLVTAHGVAQQRDLALEALAGVAQCQMETDEQPLADGELRVLHLRDESARVLACDQGSQWNSAEFEKTSTRRGGALTAGASWIRRPVRPRPYSSRARLRRD